MWFVNSLLFSPWVWVCHGKMDLWTKLTYKLSRCCRQALHFLFSPCRRVVVSGHFFSRKRTHDLLHSSVQRLSANIHIMLCCIYNAHKYRFFSSIIFFCFYIYLFLLYGRCADCIRYDVFYCIYTLHSCIIPYTCVNALGRSTRRTHRAQCQIDFNTSSHGMLVRLYLNVK